MIKSFRLRLSELKKSVSWRVLKNAGWMSATTPVNVLMGIFHTGMVARMLGPEGIGLLGLFTATSGLFGSVLKLTSSGTIVTFISRSLAADDKKDAAHIIRYCHIVDFVSSLVAYGTFIIFARYFSQLFGVSQEYRLLLVFWGVTLVLSSIYWDSQALLQLSNRFNWIFYQNLFRAILKTSLIAVLFWIGSGLQEVVWVNVLMLGIDSCCLFILGQIALRRIGIRWFLGDGASWWKVPKDVRKFQIVSHVRSIIKSVNRYVDTLMIGLIANPVQVGFFRASKQITNLLQTPLQTFNASLYPTYSRLWFSGQTQQLRRLVKRFTLGFAIVGMLGIVVLFFSVDWIIRLILGPDFLPARAIVVILLQSVLIFIMMIPLYSLPAAVGLAGPQLSAAIAALVVQLIIMWFMVPRLGAVGAAWANVAYVVIWALVLLPTIVQLLREKEPAKKSQAEDND